MCFGMSSDIGRLVASSSEPEWVGDLVGDLVGDVVGVSVGVRELNSASLVGTNVGKKVAASITEAQLCTLRADMCKNMWTDMCAYMCTGMHRDMCFGMSSDMCMHMCMDMVSRHMYGLV